MQTKSKLYCSNYALLPVCILILNLNTFSFHFSLNTVACSKGGFQICSFTQKPISFYIYTYVYFLYFFKRNFFFKMTKEFSNNPLLGRRLGLRYCSLFVIRCLPIRNKMFADCIRKRQWVNI